MATFAGETWTNRSPEQLRSLRAVTLGSWFIQFSSPESLLFGISSCSQIQLHKLEGQSQNCYGHTNVSECLTVTLTICPEEVLSKRVSAALVRKPYMALQLTQLPGKQLCKQCSPASKPAFLLQLHQHLHIPVLHVSGCHLTSRLYKFSLCFQKKWRLRNTSCIILYLHWERDPLAICSSWLSSPKSKCTGCQTIHVRSDSLNALASKAHNVFVREINDVFLHMYAFL